MKLKIIKGNYRKNYKSLKLRVAAYVRVSTELENQISSFESQRKYYYSKICRNSKWELVGIYEDYGISARSVKNRVGFNNMIKDAIDGKIDLILTKSISRFARNTVDSIEYVRLLKENNVGVLFEEENIYTLDMQSELLLTILSSVAQQESNNYSNRIKKGIEMSFSTGSQRKQLVTYGYTFRKKKLRIVKKESEVIKRIFALYIEGKSVQEISNILNNEKIKPPYNKKWVKNYVYMILRCEKYIGKIKFGDVYQYEDLRIISDEDFYKAKSIAKSRQNFLKENVDIFSGIVRCGFCGRVQGFDSGVNMYTRSTCRRGCKNGLNVSKENVNRILLEFQNELLENYNEIFNYSREDEETKKRTINKLNKSIYNEAIFDLDQRLNDKINKYEFIDKMEKIYSKHEESLNKIDIQESKNSNLKNVLSGFKERLLSIDSFPAEEASKELVQKLVKYMQFGEELKHHYKNRFNCRIVLKVNENYSPNNLRFFVDYPSICKNESYIVLWKFYSVYIYRQVKKYIKVKIVIDKRDVEVG